MSAMSSQPTSQLPAEKHTRHVSPSCSLTALRPPSFPSRPGSSILIDCSECSLTAEDHEPHWTGNTSSNQHRRQVVSIDMLLDEVLLEIFDFCANEDSNTKEEIEAWQTLVHVCRRWRYIVFGSPRRLNLRLVCTPETPARGTLDVWPALPLLVQGCAFETSGADNIAAALERRDRVNKIRLYGVDDSLLEKGLAAMQEPFPELTHLELSSYDETATVLPDSFMGGSAPRLRKLRLRRIPFLGLPKLLLSTAHLVRLHLLNIPHSGYISPEEMVTALSTLTSLEFLWLRFRSRQSRPDRRTFSPTRSVLPVLTSFWFKGATEYLEDLVARIDAPRVNDLYITPFNQIVFDTPQFIKFIKRTPTLKPLEEARVTFKEGAASVKLSSRRASTRHAVVKLEISCSLPGWQVSSLEQVCTSCLPPLSKLEDLYIYESTILQPDWQDNMENMRLELLHLFTAAKNLYVSEQFVPRVAPALQELVGDRTTEVLPFLKSVFLEGHQPSGPVQEGIGQFIAARQVTSQPIAVACWEKENDEEYRREREMEREMESRDEDDEDGDDDEEDE